MMQQGGLAHKLPLLRRHYIRPLTMASIVTKYMKALQSFGWRGTFNKMYMMGEVKFGDFMGEDVNGNKYFENVAYPFGQHRWVEYKDLHNYEPTSVPPIWHGWLHHQTDETPATMITAGREGEKIAEGVSTPYSIATGKTDYKMEPQLNWTAHRQRGYKIGSLQQGPDDPDKYYTQPGSLNCPPEDRIRISGPEVEEWDPKDPEGKNTSDEIRPLDKI